MNRENWDDLRFVLAVAETGSVNRAGQRLGVTHATVLRRVAAFEAHNGEPIFLKSPNGYKVLPGKMPVIEKARQVQETMLGLAQDRAAQQNAPSGAGRITSTDTLCQLVLPKMVRKISRLYPALDISLLSTNQRLDFSRLIADISVRPAPSLEPALVGEMVGQLGFAVYHRRKAERHWLGLTGRLAASEPAKWMAEHVRPADIREVADSFLVLREMLAEGGGRAFLPCFVGDPDPRLERTPDQPATFSAPIWVAQQRELAQTARLKAVNEQLAMGFRAIAPLLAG